jgi:hypothetical protein
VTVDSKVLPSVQVEGEGRERDTQVRWDAMMDVKVLKMEGGGGGAKGPALMDVWWSFTGDYKATSSQVAKHGAAQSLKR